MQYFQSTLAVQKGVCDEGEGGRRPNHLVVCGLLGGVVLGPGACRDWHEVQVVLVLNHHLFDGLPVGGDSMASHLADMLGRLHLS